MAKSAEKQKEYFALEQFLNPQFTEYHKYNTKKTNSPIHCDKNKILY